MSNTAAGFRTIRPWPWGLGAGAAAALWACNLEPLAQAAVFAAMLLGAFALWILQTAGRWVVVFLVAALCLPPLPIAIGDSGPHLATGVAMLGGIAGVLRWRQWTQPLPRAAFALPLFGLLLLLGLPFAAFYSGPGIAAASLARVTLFVISIYIFLFIAGGPGEHSPARTLNAMRWVYAAAVASASFACIDFYFQFPAPAGFGPQFIWLDSGVYRRAQGLFYEASTLGNVCSFFLVFAVVSWSYSDKLQPVRRACLLLGSIPILAALLLSFSRASLLNLSISLSVLAMLRIKRLQLSRLLILLSAGFAAALAVIYAIVPVFVEFYWLRLTTSLDQLLQGNERLLSGRVEAWSTLTGFLWDHPWHLLIGIGYKTLPYSDFIGEPIVADNTYLSALVETGLIGLAGLLALHVAVLRMAWRARASNNALASLCGTWVFCFWIGEIVQMFSGDLLTYWRVLPLYFWALALAVRHAHDQSAV